MESIYFLASVWDETREPRSNLESTHKTVQTVNGAVLKYHNFFYSECFTFIPMLLFNAEQHLEGFNKPPLPNPLVLVVCVLNLAVIGRKINEYVKNS